MDWGLLGPGNGYHDGYDDCHDDWDGGQDDKHEDNGMIIAWLTLSLVQSAPGSLTKYEPGCFYRYQTHIVQSDDDNEKCFDPVIFSKSSGLF